MSKVRNFPSAGSLKLAVLGTDFNGNVLEVNKSRKHIDIAVYNDDGERLNGILLDEQMAKNLLLVLNHNFMKPRDLDYEGA